MKSKSSKMHKHYKSTAYMQFLFFLGEAIMMLKKWVKKDNESTQIIANNILLRPNLYPPCLQTAC